MEKVIYNNITLSFSGKRNHQGLDMLPKALQELYTALNGEFHHTHFHLLTGLADGADQAAAQAFVDSSLSSESNKWTMGAVMPFAKDEYLKTIENKTRFEELYASELLHQKLHLDGVYEEGDHGKAYRTKAYRQQGWVLARFADIMVCVADKEDSGKAGGTMENLVTALQQKKPVLFYDLGSHTFSLYEEVEQWFLNTPKADSLQEIVADLYRRFIGGKNQELTAEMKQMLGEPLFPSHGLSKRRIIIWKGYENLWKKKSGGNRQPGSQPPPDAPYATIKKERQNISKTADTYQTQYRGGYMLNYVYSALAITIAVAAIVYYIFMAKYFPFKIAGENLGIWSIVFSLKHFPWQYLPLVILGLIKIMLIRQIIHNTHEANHHNYNKLAINYRYASERLKFNEYLSFAGIFNPPKPTLGKHSQYFLQNNAGEFYFEDKLSKLKENSRYVIDLTPQKVLNHIDFLKKEWYDGQKKYHENKTQQFGNEHTQLEHLAIKLSITVLWIVGIEIAIKIAEGFVVLPYSLKSFLSYAAPVLLGLAILLPAIVAILVSINFQNENKKISDRHAVIVKGINKAKENIENRETEARNKLQEGCLFQTALMELDEMGTLMIDDVAEWMIFYENKVYEI